jgi:hypothetical protein
MRGTFGKLLTGALLLGGLAALAMLPARVGSPPAFGVHLPRPAAPAVRTVLAVPPPSRPAKTVHSIARAEPVARFVAAPVSRRHSAATPTRRIVHRALPPAEPKAPAPPQPAPVVQPAPPPAPPEPPAPAPAPAAAPAPAPAPAPVEALTVLPAANASVGVAPLNKHAAKRAQKEERKQLKREEKAAAPPAAPTEPDPAPPVAADPVPAAPPASAEAPPADDAGPGRGNGNGNGNAWGHEKNGKHD